MASLCRYSQRKAAILFEKRVSSYCRLRALVNKLNQNLGKGMTCFLRDATQSEVIIPDYSEYSLPRAECLEYILCILELE